MFEWFKNKFGIHDHNFQPTGKEYFKGVSDWHVMKVKETKCTICGKIQEKAISFIRV